MRSMAASMRDTAFPVTAMPSRNLPISVSAACVSASEPGQSKKAARSFDGMNKAENVGKNLAVIRLSLKAHQLRVDVIEAFGGLGQKFTQQLVHERLVPPTTGV